MTLRSEVSARLAAIKDISTGRLLELAVAEADGRLRVMQVGTVFMTEREAKAFMERRKNAGEPPPG